MKPTIFRIPFVPTFPRPMLLAALGLGFVFSPTLLAQTSETFPLSQGTNDEWKIHTFNTEGPASDWNHFDMKVAETSLRSIMPNYLSGDPVNIEEMNRFNKHLVAETVLLSTGQIGAWVQNGTVVAVEFAMFSTDPFPSPTAYQSVTGSIVGENMAGQQDELGTMYCFNQAQYEQRISELTVIMGRSPNQPTVWLGNTLQSATTGSKSLRVQGTANVVVGSVHANGDLRIGGESHVLLQGLTHVGMFIASMGGHQLGPHAQASSKALPAPAHGAAWYQSEAVAGGTFFAGDLLIRDDGQGGLMSSTGVALGGVVYATGDITVESSGLTGKVTLVAEGAVDFPASNCLLGPAADDLLMWSTSTTATDAIAIDGSGCVLTGAVYAPSVEFRMGGSTNQLAGRIIADAIKVTGSLNFLSDGTK